MEARQAAELKKVNLNLIKCEEAAKNEIKAIREEAKTQTS